jgi:hypothetical protein
MGFRKNSMLTTYETKLASTKVDVHNKSTNMRRTWHRLALTKSLTFTTIDSQVRKNMTWIFKKKIHAHNNILANARRTQHVLSIKKLTLTIDQQNLFELCIMLVVCTWSIFYYGFKLTIITSTSHCFFDFLLKHLNVCSHILKLDFDSIPSSSSSMINPWPSLHFWHPNSPKHSPKPFY